MLVFLMDISAVDEKELKRLAATLPPFRRETAKRCSKANYPQHVLSFCLARHALRSIAPNADTESWCFGAQGKPMLKGHEAYFNLSHTAHAVAVAVSTSKEVGIDIEEVKPRRAGFAARYFSNEEQRLVSVAADPVDELIRIWSSKEAEAKRRGTGLSQGIPSISIEAAQSVPLTVGRLPHRLSVSPCVAMPPIKWVTTDQLLS